jgi:hypothetical protein
MRGASISQLVTYNAQRNAINDISKLEASQKEPSEKFAALLITTIDPSKHPHLLLHSLLIVFDSPRSELNQLPHPTETHTGMPLLVYELDVLLNKNFFTEKRISNGIINHSFKDLYNQPFINKANQPNPVKIHFTNKTYKTFSDIMPAMASILWAFDYEVIDLISNRYDLKSYTRKPLLPEFDKQTIRLKTGLIELWGHPPRPTIIQGKNKKELTKDEQKLVTTFNDLLNKRNSKKINTDTRNKIADELQRIAKSASFPKSAFEPTFGIKATNSCSQVAKMTIEEESNLNTVHLKFPEKLRP